MLDMEATQMSIDRWTDKEDVVYIYTMENYSAIKKKEQNWVSCTDVDEPRAYYTAWSKSEGEKQISYINASIWSLEKSTDESLCRTGMEAQMQSTDV